MYRLHYITSLYDTYLQRIYARDLSLASQSYEQQKRVIQGDCFGVSQFWTAELTQIGYQASEIITNATPLQRSWARENGLPDTVTAREIVLAQVRRFNPEIIVIDDMGLFEESYLDELRNCAPALCLVVGWCGSPYRSLSCFRGLDLVISNIREFIDTFSAAGVPCEHMHHAFAPSVLAKLDLSKPQTIDLSFLGALIKGEGFHRTRKRLLTTLVKQTAIQIFSDVPRAGRLCRIRQQLRGAKNYLRGEATTSSFLVDPAVSQVARESRYGLAMFQTLRDSKITLNAHIDVSPRSASNMRLFEATGVGACLLTDWREGISELFEPEQEIVTYRSAEECVERVDYLLCNEAARAKIARAGAARTARDHNFGNRMKQFDEIIKRRIAR